MSASSKRLYFPSGETRLEAPLIVGPDMLVEGDGKSSVLRWDGPGPGLIFGPESGFMYGGWVRDLSLACGVLVRRNAQHCGMSNVWIGSAAGDGLEIRGSGERMVFRDVVCYGSGGRGLLISPDADTSMNGLLFDHCTFQANKGAGVWLETINGAELLDPIFRDCTIQGNGVPLLGDLNGDGQVDMADLAKALQAGDLASAQAVSRNMGTISRVPADLVLRGNVKRVNLDGTWIEPTLTGVAIDGEGGAAVRTLGTTTISIARRAAMKLRSCGKCELERLVINVGCGPAVMEATEFELGDVAAAPGMFPAARIRRAG